MRLRLVVLHRVGQPVFAAGNRTDAGRLFFASLPKFYPAEKFAVMLLPTLAVAFAAFCVWLTVRIVSRRERWAKWALGAGLRLPVGYVLGFGPWGWVSTRLAEPEEPFVGLPAVFVPL